MWQGQLSYGYKTNKGVPGGLCDISPYRIESRVNGENDGALSFGVGVVKNSTNPGQTVNLPGATSVAGDFDGIVLNGFITQEALDGTIALKNLASVNVLKWGAAWGRVVAGKTTKYGDPLYLVNQTAGDAVAGQFSNTATEGANNNIALKGRFLGAVDNGIAPIEIYNEAQA